MFVALIFMIKSTKKTEIDLKETLKGVINNNNIILGYNVLLFITIIAPMNLDI